MIKLFRITTVPISLQILLGGQLRYISRVYEVTGISSSGAALEKVALSEGIRTVAVEMTRNISPIKDLRALWKLCRVIQKENPDIVHSHTPKAGILSMLAAWLCRVPVRMHTVAGLPLLEASGFKRNILNYVEKITYACATRVYPNSSGLKAIILRNKFCNESKLRVIGNGSSNGIDTEHFSIQKISSDEICRLKKEYKIGHGDFVFIFIGRLVADKGINELAWAFEKVQQKHPYAKLMLVGETEPELDPIKSETIKLLHNNNAVILTGFQSDVRPFLAISHALVFPSYREGFPNAPMQAGAMGLPSIVTDISGCSEIVQHEYNGLIIPPKNTQAIEEAMLRLIEDKGLTCKLASKARESIVSRFDQRTLWEQIKREYDEQLALAGF
jgi:glycosyltransferase involved in cell wall biosynthesis